MFRNLAIVLTLLLAAPTWASDLQFWEDSQGAPGVTANFNHGTQLSADIDFDADTAEGGGLSQGATEIELRPTGSVSFVDFVCELEGCFPNVDYVFTPGSQAQGGRVLISDDFQPKNGILDLGTLTLDAPQDPGSLDLVDCNYTGLDYVERTCDPFVLVSLPEPGGPLALALAVLLLVGGSGRYRPAAGRSPSKATF